MRRISTREQTRRSLERLDVERQLREYLIQTPESTHLVCRQATPEEIKKYNIKIKGGEESED